MFDFDFSALDAPATLATAAEAREVSDRAEVAVLQSAAQWADLHGHLDEAASGRSLPGTERLVRLGGAGTPPVAEFAAAELGAVLEISPAAAARLMGDVLDLRHRLPRLWKRVLAGEVKPWLARKTADTTRHLSVEVTDVVDRRVTPWAHAVSLARLDSLVQAAIIAADPDGAAAEVAAAEAAQGVWLSQSNDHGIKAIHIRTQASNAIWFDASIQRVADSLESFGDKSSLDVRRARAVGILAQPQQALDLIDQTVRLTAGDAGSETRTERGARQAASGVAARPPVTLYMHLSQDAFTRDDQGVARFEGEGPVTVDQVRRWLGHCNVTVKPVIDLANQIPVDAYEVPDRLREAMHLRSPVDVFPFATNAGRNRQADHSVPYVDPGDGGPPGQTALDNLGPMVTFHHRLRTHGRWQVRQVFNGVFVWRSPHGHHYLVDHTGTHPAGRAS